MIEIYQRGVEKVSCEPHKLGLRVRFSSAQPTGLAMRTKEQEWEVSRKIMGVYGFEGPPISREALVKSGYSIPADGEPYWELVERCHSEFRWMGRLIHPIFQQK